MCSVHVVRYVYFLAVTWQFLNIRTILIDFRKADREVILRENMEKYGRLAAL